MAAKKAAGKPLGQIVQLGGKAVALSVSHGVKHHLFRAALKIGNIRIGNPLMLSLALKAEKEIPLEHLVITLQPAQGRAYSMAVSAVRKIGGWLQKHGLVQIFR